MKEKETKPEVKVETKPEVKVETKQEVNNFKELYGSLRNEINASRENFTQQLKQIKEAIVVRTQEIETLKIRELKLTGAIEASDIYLKAALPNNNPK